MDDKKNSGVSINPGEIGICKYKEMFMSTIQDAVEVLGYDKIPMYRGGSRPSAIISVRKWALISHFIELNRICNNIIAMSYNIWFNLHKKYVNRTARQSSDLLFTMGSMILCGM
jgi:hypothetical protein